MNRVRAYIKKKISYQSYTCVKVASLIYKVAWPGKPEFLSWEWQSHFCTSHLVRQALQPTLPSALQIRSLYLWGNAPRA
jgi:hypothetical protein